LTGSSPSGIGFNGYLATMYSMMENISMQENQIREHLFEEACKNETRYTHFNNHLDEYENNFEQLKETMADHLQHLYEHMNND
jgi:hypothetical protein